MEGIRINQKPRNPDDIFDESKDTIECIKKGQRDGVEIALKALPHTKWVDCDTLNRDILRREL